jgi:hypothetical protein
MVSYVKIFGGLGNQLFQYSFGQYLLTINKDYNIKYDLSYFKNEDAHELVLNKYNIDFEPITEKEQKKLTPSFVQKIFRRIGKDHLIYNIEYEKDTFIFKDIKPKEERLYVGYWQNTKYLKKNELYLKKIFNPNYKIDTKLERDYINIGIHVRRGDYLNIDKYKVYNDDYYFKSINFIDTKIHEPKKYFIFSDEIDYCKKLFNNLKNCYFVEDSNTLGDFELMKCMDHIIISNSTFSWWAAWLSDKKNKITICPKIWMKGNENVELIQKNWIKL